MTLRALVLEDDRASREAVVRLLKREGFEPLPADSLRAARAHLRDTRPDLLLLDVELPDGSGLELLEELDDHPDADVVIVSGAATVDDAVYAMREGAIDVLGKPVDAKKLRRTLAAARRTARLRHQVGALRGELKNLGRFGRIVGKSPAIERVYELVARVAPTDAMVLITGETGSGKEIVARSVHDLGPRADGPFVPVNCGAVPPDLIESELFGHEKGAFTGASRSRRGVFEKAGGGTLFLDEVTEMSPELQVRLLRVLESREIRRVGGERAIPIDARIVAATNRPPEEAVRAGKLRKDLLFRLDVFRIEVPPLRERGADVERLARHFLEEMNETHDGAKRWTDGALRRLQAHPWPGNVRELRNAVERAWIVAGDEIGARDVGLGSPGPDAGAAGDAVATDAADAPSAVPAAGDRTIAVPVGASIAEAERRLIEATLDDVDGDKRRAAEILGISLKTLYNRLNAYSAAGGTGAGGATR